MLQVFYATYVPLNVVNRREPNTGFSFREVYRFRFDVALTAPLQIAVSELFRAPNVDR